jgi:phosphoglycolate phosphatase
VSGEWRVVSGKWFWCGAGLEKTADWVIGGAMHLLKAVLFDLDGTLIDSLADLGQAVNRTLADLGLPGHPVERCREYIGEGARRLVERALPAEVQGDAGLVDRALGLYQAHYESGWRDQTSVYPGMHALLRRLRDEGMRLGVISNKPHPFTRLCVEHFFPDAAFGLVLGQREEVPRKPDPAAAFEAADCFGVGIESCCYVGDSGVDMAFAKAAGMRAIGVAWGFRDREELWKSGASEVVEDAGALEKVLLG